MTGRLEDAALLLNRLMAFIDQPAPRDPVGEDLEWADEEDRCSRSTRPNLDQWQCAAVESPTVLELPN